MRVSYGGEYPFKNYFNKGFVSVFEYILSFEVVYEAKTHLLIKTPDVRLHYSD